MLQKMFLVTQKYLDTHCVRKTKEKTKKKKIVRDLFDEAVKLRSSQTLPRTPQTEQIFSSRISTPEPSEDVGYESRQGVPESQHINVETPRLENKEIGTYTKESFGHIAGAYLAPYLHSPRATDTIYGIYRDKDGNFKIGDSQIEIQEDDLYVKVGISKGVVDSGSCLQRNL
jgi:hypothetical protein